MIRCVVAVIMVLVLSTSVTQAEEQGTTPLAQVMRLVSYGTYTQDCTEEDWYYILKERTLPACAEDDPYARVSIHPKGRVDVYEDDPFAGPPFFVDRFEQADVTAVFVQVVRFPVSPMELGVWHTRLRELADKYRDNAPNYVVYDFRSNLGGLVRTALELTCLRMETNGKALYEVRMIKGERDVRTDEVCHEYGLPPVFKNVPTIVLVDQHTISAPELVTGILRRAGNTTVVGFRTRGKDDCQYREHVDLGDVELVLQLSACKMEVPGIELAGGIVPDLAPNDGPQILRDMGLIH